MNGTDRYDRRGESPMLSTEQWHERLLRSFFVCVEFVRLDSDGKLRKNDHDCYKGDLHINFIKVP